MKKTHNTLSDAIQNGPGTISARVIILTVLPTLLGLSVWSAERIVSSLDELIAKVENNHVEVLQVTGKLDARITGVEHDFAASQRGRGL